MQLSQNAIMLSKTLQGWLKPKLEASLFCSISHSSARQSGALEPEPSQLVRPAPGPGATTVGVGLPTPLFSLQKASKGSTSAQGQSQGLLRLEQVLAVKHEPHPCTTFHNL